MSNPIAINHENTSHLPEQARKAVVDFQLRILDLFPGEISHIILYGSYAHSKATTDSDVDLMIVVKWDENRLPDGMYVAPISNPKWQSIINAATDSMLATGYEIAPVVVSKKRYDAGFPLANRVKREGIVIWTSPN